jgi:hypothetical protein
LGVGRLRLREGQDISLAQGFKVLPVYLQVAG